MDLLVVSLVAFVASGLTLVSGFGLGTLLTPAFALFFPIETAVGATAVVHLANNIFKTGLVGRDADLRVVVRFGAPAAAAAFAGASALVSMAALPPIVTYDAWGALREVTPVKLVVGTLIVVFAMAELSPRASAWAVPARYLPWGGALSGFFGGLSGNQGALRTAFLIKAGLTKEAFIATSVLCSVAVDVSRLLVYGGTALSAGADAWPPGVASLVAAACVAAFTGAWLGARVMRKLTLRGVQLVVAVMMMAVGGALAAGLV